MLYELLLKYGLDLAVLIEERQIDGKTVFIIGAGALIVCLADDISLDVVEGIAALKEELQPEVMRVVFKEDRKSTRLNSSHTDISRMPSFA